jgi:hypothetical protein
MFQIKSLKLKQIVVLHPANFFVRRAILGKIKNFDMGMNKVGFTVYVAGMNKITFHQQNLVQILTPNSINIH